MSWVCSIGIRVSGTGLKMKTYTNEDGYTGNPIADGRRFRQILAPVLLDRIFLVIFILAILQSCLIAYVCHKNEQTRNDGIFCISRSNGFQVCQLVPSEQTKRIVVFGY